MTSVILHRNLVPKYANTLGLYNGNPLGENQMDAIGRILENPEEPWSTLKKKLRQVPDRTKYDENDDEDYGPSTILGRHGGFMKPFNDSIHAYRNLYKKIWCKSTPPDPRNPDVKDFTQIIQMHANPFVARGNENLKDPSFAQKIEIRTGTKVIVVGDVHSGLQSLVDIIENLVNKGILDNSLVVSEKYTVIFLGDVVDRGPFGLECLHLLFRMKVKNLSSFFLINANHEDAGTYDDYDLGRELKFSLSPPDENKVRSLLTYLPSVIFGFMEETKTWIQFNHGGIDERYEPKNFLDSTFEFHYHGFDREDTGELVLSGLRWNDFNGRIDVIQDGSRGGTVKEYGKQATEDYLSRNNISGIIRGHQDFNHCALMPINDRNHREMEEIEDSTGGGMLYPPAGYWKDVDLLSGWDQISISNAFNSFSVITTSTATRARVDPGERGYNAYLEIISDSDHFAETQDRNMIAPFEAFASTTGVRLELEFLMNAKYGDTHMVSNEQKGRWDRVISEWTQEQSEYYTWLVLDSFGMIIEGEIVEEEDDEEEDDEETLSRARRWAQNEEREEDEVQIMSRGEFYGEEGEIEEGEMEEGEIEEGEMEEGEIDPRAPSDPRKRKRTPLQIPPKNVKRRYTKSYIERQRQEARKAREDRIKRTEENKNKRLKEERRVAEILRKKKESVSGSIRG